MCTCPQPHLYIGLVDALMLGGRLLKKNSRADVYCGEDAYEFSWPNISIYTFYNMFIISLTCAVVVVVVVVVIFFVVVVVVVVAP